MRTLVGCVALVAVAGCQTDAPRPSAPATNAVVSNAERPGRASRRVWTPRQMEVLQQFALSEAPKLWQTVQDLKVEQSQRRAGLARLKGELEDFGRSPSTDADYQNLVREANELDGVVNAILQKIEDAYIAQQKFRATPSRGDYAALMKSALENGIQEADAATSRFRKMAREK